MGISRRRFLHCLAACGAAGLLGVDKVAANPPSQAFAAAFARGVAFLTTPQPAGQYNPDLHLLREAPTAAPCKYWLFNDNALAAHLLARLGHDPASDILAQLRTYGHDINGLHEVLWGQTVGDSLD